MYLQLRLRPKPRCAVPPVAAGCVAKPAFLPSDDPRHEPTPFNPLYAIPSPGLCACLAPSLPHAGRSVNILHQLLFRPRSSHTRLTLYPRRQTLFALFPLSRVKLPSTEVHWAEPLRPVALNRGACLVPTGLVRHGLRARLACRAASARFHLGYELTCRAWRREQVRHHRVA